MVERTKYNPFGKIKSRIFAFILLMLSCSLALSAFKSLGRSFDGLIVYKEIKSGFIQKNYDLYIDKDYKVNENQEISNKDVINIFSLNFDDYTKVGVSYFAYEAAEKSLIIKKEKNSPLIELNGEKFIDQGVFWGILSIIGMFISYLIYKQTLIKFSESNEDENKLNEEIEL